MDRAPAPPHALKVGARPQSAGTTPARAFRFHC
jgi:hypothetical protein